MENFQKSKTPREDYCSYDKSLEMTNSTELACGDLIIMKGCLGTSHPEDDVLPPGIVG